MSKINLKDYLDTLKHMRVGQSFKVVHEGCSESKALSINCDVEGYWCHCFKCQGKGWLPHEGSSFRDIKQREKERDAYRAERMKEGFNLPGDFSTLIPSAGLSWLGQGGWSEDLIYKHGAGWSEYLGRVIFKIKPVGYIARAVFNDQVPKYLSKSPKKVITYWTSEPITDRVCLTEDILSAGRVGQLYPAMAGLGTDGWQWPDILNCKEVLIWTDNDKGGEHGRAVIHKLLDWMPDIKVRDIYSPKDPKAYTIRELQTYLNVGGANV